MADKRPDVDKLKRLVDHAEDSCFADDARWELATLLEYVKGLEVLTKHQTAEVVRLAKAYVKASDKVEELETDIFKLMQAKVND
jgi:hypothetical protein